MKGDARIKARRISQVICIFSFGVTAMYQSTPTQTNTARMMKPIPPV